MRGNPVGAAMLGAFIVAGVPIQAHAQDRFTTGAWLAPGSVEDGTRRRMLDDLLANHLKIGMSQIEVRALLGVDGPADAPLNGGPASYLIDRGFGDYWLLYVTFGPDGRVASIAEVQG